MRRIALPTLAASMLMTVPALAAIPAGGSMYRGSTSQDRAVSARVTSDAKGLQLEFNEVFRCSQGPSKVLRATYQKQRPTIHRDGTFDYTKTYRDLPAMPGFEERRTERQHVTGRFTAEGSRIKGRSATVIVGRSGLRCTSTVTFTARKRT